MKNLVSTLDKKNERDELIAVDDHAVCLLKMADKTEGVLEASWCCYGTEEDSTVLYCKNRVMKIFSDPRYDIILEMKDGKRVYYDMGGISTNDKQLKSGVIDAFIKSLTEKEEPLIPEEEGYNALAIISVCMESSKLRKWVKIRNYKKSTRGGMRYENFSLYRCCI